MKIFISPSPMPMETLFRSVLDPILGKYFHWRSSYINYISVVDRLKKVKIIYIDVFLLRNLGPLPIGTWFINLNVEIDIDNFNVPISLSGSIDKYLLVESPTQDPKEVDSLPHYMVKTTQLDQLVVFLKKNYPRLLIESTDRFDEYCWVNLSALLELRFNVTLKEIPL